MKSCAGTLLLIALLAFPVISTGSGALFFPPLTISRGNDQCAITLGDFDEDGHVDFAVANEDASTISIFLGNGDGTFALSGNLTTDSGPYSIAAEDFDEDGHIDLAVANTNANNLSILIGNGDGTFDAAVNYGTGGWPWHVATGDFDEDGHVDIAVGNVYSDDISILIGAGDGTFASAVTYNAPHDPYAIAVEDFDEDGHIDLAVAQFSQNNVLILTGVGDGTFTVGSTFGAGSSPEFVIAADFDEDGHADLATANYGSSNVSILLGAGDGSFAAAANYNAVYHSSAVAAADYDEDGHLDLAVSGTGAQGISVLLGFGDGSFEAPQSYGTPGAVINGKGITAGDLDGDGHADLAVGHYFPDCINIFLNAMDPEISNVSDIPNDQGGQVRVMWNGCYHDALGMPYTITEYAVYRRIDYLLHASPAASENGAPGRPYPGEPGRPVLLYPPGDWDCLVTIPACAEQEYSVVVPTLADSTIAEGMYYSTFFVRALTPVPGIHFDAEPDSGYSVDNLEPGAPGGFMVAYNGVDGNELTWEECPDGDFNCFNIYRGEDAGFEPGPDNLTHSTAGLQWIDTVDEGWRYHYKITSLDFSGNESDPRSPDEVTGAEAPRSPSPFALGQNYPNPFNPVTTIRFDLASDAEVDLSIFDVNGARVRSLVSGKMTAGCKTVEWDGRNDEGKPAASGIYFYRLTAGTFRDTRKMILMR